MCWRVIELIVSVAFYSVWAVLLLTVLLDDELRVAGVVAVMVFGAALLPAIPLPGASFWKTGRKGERRWKAE